jgi:pimeloyl-ACP methyl ester carboxylesterase
MPQSIYEFGGKPDAPIMQLALANGFSPQTYTPLLESFTEHYRVVSLPPRALWDGNHQPSETQAWRELADDLLAGMDAYNLNNVIAVGHSFGGIASALAAIKQPKRFRALILLDPTIMPTLFMNVVRLLRLIGAEDRIPLASGALRRRSRFASVDEAFHYFKGKRLFADWSERAVRLYAEGGLRSAADGDGFELAWSPQWEAQYYRKAHTGVWGDVRKLRGLLPILVIRGGTSDTFVKAAADKFCRLVPEADYAEIAGHGHLCPQSAPEATYQVIAEWLKKLN